MEQQVIDVIGYCAISAFVGLIFMISGYLLLEYSHESEKEFFMSFAMKVLILLGGGLSMFVLLAMVIDVLSIANK